MIYELSSLNSLEESWSSSQIIVSKVRSLAFLSLRLTFVDSFLKISDPVDDNADFISVVDIEMVILGCDKNKFSFFVMFVNVREDV